MLKKWIVEIYNKDNIAVTYFIEFCQTAKGVEKKHKQKFKEYRELGYSWTIKEVA